MKRRHKKLIGGEDDDVPPEDHLRALEAERDLHERIYDHPVDEESERDSFAL